MNRHCLASRQLFQNAASKYSFGHLVAPRLGLSRLQAQRSNLTLEKQTDIASMPVTSVPASPQEVVPETLGEVVKVFFQQPSVLLPCGALVILAIQRSQQPLSLWDPLGTCQLPSLHILGLETGVMPTSVWHSHLCNSFYVT
jgi:hypothetical protein